MKRKRGEYKFKNSKHAKAYIKGVYFHQMDEPSETLYGKLNKLYKNVDFTKGFIGMADAKEILKDDNRYFPRFESLKKNDIIHPYRPRGGSCPSYIPLDELEQEMLRREMCCHKDDLIRQQEYQSKNRKSRMAYEREKDEIVVKLDGYDYNVGAYHPRMGKQIEKTVKLLYKYEDIFKKGNKPYVYWWYVKSFFKLLLKNGENNDIIKQWIEKHDVSER